MINIFVSNGISYIWSPEDWYSLRRNHRIMGYFDGAEGEGWTGSIHLNLPLRLSNVETQYIVKQGIGRTVELAQLYELKPPVLFEEYNQIKTEWRNKQFEEFKEKRRVIIESNVEKILEGKMKKARSTVIPDRNAVIRDELDKIKSLPFEMTKIDLEDPWANRDDFTLYNFPLPKTELDHLRYRVFEDFHSRGQYYISDGTKFGGDFLAYPGDPIHFHSEFIIMCEKRDQRITQLHIDSQRRLAQTVNKVLVIASFESLDQVANFSSAVVYTKYDRRPSKKIRDIDELLIDKTNCESEDLFLLTKRRKLE